MDLSSLEVEREYGRVESGGLPSSQRSQSRTEHPQTPRQNSPASIKNYIEDFQDNSGGSDSRLYLGDEGSQETEPSSATLLEQQIRPYGSPHVRSSWQASSSSQDHDYTQDVGRGENLVATWEYQPYNFYSAQPNDTAQYYPTYQPSDSMNKESTYRPQDFQLEPPKQTAQFYSTAKHPDPESSSRFDRGGPVRDSEKFDPLYQVRTKDSRRFFKVGRVFSTLWTGHQKHIATMNDPILMSEVEFGEMVYIKVQRFVIVRVNRDRGSVTCLPVNSCGVAGPKNSGINFSEHGFIYSKRKPQSVEGLRRKALKVVLSPRPAGSLIDPSLIHYGKIYTVETNVAVKEIGKLDIESTKTLLHYFNKVFGVYRDLEEPKMTPAVSRFALFRVGIPGHVESSEMPQSDFNSTPIPLHSLPSQYSFTGDFTASTESGAYLRSQKTLKGSATPYVEETKLGYGSRTLDELPPRSSDAHTQGDFNRGRLAMQNKEPIGSKASHCGSDSSMSSFTSQSDILHRLFDVLWYDSELQVLFKESSRRVSMERFEHNFRKCLLQFSAHLRVEASLSSWENKAAHAARAVQNLYRSIARLIRKSLEVVEKVNGENAIASDDGPNILEANDPEVSEDEDDNAEDDKAEDIEEEVNKQDTFEDLETKLKGSKSFDMLRENLRIFLYPDSAQKSLFQVWPVTYPRSLPLEMTYQVEWEAVLFLRTHFAEGQKLGEVLTLTGGSIHAQASSCRNYLSTTWPEVGILLLEGLETLTQPQNEVFVKNSKASLKLKHEDTKTGGMRSRLTVKVRATHAIHHKLLLAFSWISAAIRYSPHDQVSCSTVSIEAYPLPRAGQSIFLRLLELKPIQDSTEACWHILFPHAVVATGHLIDKRIEGRGLEISFADMLLMSRSLSFVEYNGGLIVEGLRSLLLPVAELPKDDAVQWHFADRLKTTSRRHARISDILRANKISDWHKELEPHHLIERRCFLGWAEEAHIAMGTKKYFWTEIRPSGTTATPNKRNTNTHSITIGTSGMGFATGTGTRTWATTSMPSRLTFPLNKDIYDTLADGRDNHVIIYDNDAKISWWIPLASVALYLAHVVIQRRKYGIYDRTSPSTLKFATPSYDGDAKASEVLKDSLDLRVRKFESKMQVVEKPFSETVRQILHALIKVGSELEGVEQELKEAGITAPKYIYGVEFVDIIKMKESMRIKQAEVNQPWAHFTKYQPIVVFCRGLGQPVVASRPERLCGPWGKVPANENYLVALGTAVLSVLQEEDNGEEGSRLDRRVEWVLQQSVIQCHRRGHRDPILHVQRLRSVKSSRVAKQIISTIRHNIKGGFIFANDAYCSHSRYRCSAPLREGFSEIYQPLEDTVESPENGSKTSEDTNVSRDVEWQKGSPSSQEARDTPGSDLQRHARPSAPIHAPQLPVPATACQKRHDENISTTSPYTTSPKHLPNGLISCVPWDQKTIRRKEKLVSLRLASVDNLNKQQISLSSETYSERMAFSTLPSQEIATGNVQGYNRGKGKGKEREI